LLTPALSNIDNAIVDECAASMSCLLLLVLQGDQLIATSGVTYSTEEEYGEVKVKKGQKVVRINAIGQVGFQRVCVLKHSLSYFLIFF
jgi:hypothetical protein